MIFAFPLLRCTSSLIDRTLSDYLVLENGKSWVFLDNKGDTVIRTVVGDTVILGDSAKIVNFGGEVSIYRIGDQEVDLYSDYKTYRGGEEVQLESRFSLYFETPFVLGNKWNDSYQTSVEFLGDTFKYRHNLEGEVVSLEEVKVPAGDFNDVYRVKIREIRYVAGPYSEETDTVLEIFYFAPDVGLVKKILEEGDSRREYELVSY